MKDDANENLRTINRGLFSMIWVLVLLLAGSLYAWHQARQQIKVYIPPDLSRGALLSDGEISKSTVFATADYLFRHLNFWPDDGEQDYRARIDHLAAMLTPACRVTLEKDYNLRRRNIHGVNELAGRKRYLYAAPGAAFAPDRVQVLSGDAWTVNLDMRVTEFQHDRQIKDTLVRYPLRIVRMEANPEMNPWQMALDCFAGEPQRLDDESLAANESAINQENRETSP